jgi:protein phosphatase
LSTVVLRYTAAALTDRGQKRASNEDAFGLSIEHGVFVVCDGMGGAAAGEVASSLAVEEMLRQLTSPAVNESDSELAESTPLDLVVREAVWAANAAIYSRARRNSRYSGMGTTLVGLLTRARRVLVLNVGDSRCYRLRSGVLEQLTLDHSLVEEQVRMGRLSSADAQRSPLRNVITRALGTYDEVTPDIFEHEARIGDLFLLCSDGLTRELTDAQIESLLAAGLTSHDHGEPKLGEPKLEELCARLVDAANQAGGRDNITCLLVRACAVE